MKIINLGATDSALNNIIAELRDKRIQKDPMRFRKNVERMGYIFGYELSKTMKYSTKDVETPLGIAQVPTCDTDIVLTTILRAGLPLQAGLLNIFDKAQCGFVTAYRKYSKGNSFKINIEYCSSPDLNGKTLILSDTMLATGSSIIAVLDKLMEFGKPEYIHIVNVICSQYAVDSIKKNYPEDNITLWTAAIDEELTSRSYIVPGLGDAGDLSFGEKL